MAFLEQPQAFVIRNGEMQVADRLRCQFLADGSGRISNLIDSQNCKTSKQKRID